MDCALQVPAALRSYNYILTTSDTVIPSLPAGLSSITPVQGARPCLVRHFLETVITIMNCSQSLLCLGVCSFCPSQECADLEDCTRGCLTGGDLCRAGVTIVFSSALAAASAPLAAAAPAPGVAQLPGATILAFPADLPYGGPFALNAGTPVPAGFTPPAALAGYNFTQLPADSGLPNVPAGYFVLPINSGLTAIVPANSSLLEDGRAASAATIASLPAALASMPQSPFAGWMQVVGAPVGSLVLELPTETSLSQLSPGSLTALAATPNGLPAAAVYGVESIQDGLAQTFPGSTFQGLFGNILAVAA